MTAELIIFDCDGVLVDSERLLQRVDLEMIAELGWPITIPEIYDEHLGRSTRDFVANVERHIGRPVPDGWLELRRNACRALFERELAPVPGIAQAISSLQAAGATTCVGSSGSHDAIRHSLNLTGLWETFRGRIFSAEDVERGKPAPDLFLHAAASMGSVPGSCIVVEDSPAGVEAARAAGMTVVGYAGLTPARLLGDADVLITRMSDLATSIT